MWTFIFFIFLTLTCTHADSKAENASLARDRLKNHLFINYNPHMEPLTDGLDAVNVHINFELQHFIYDESTAACDFYGELNIQWNDENLTWNPQEYHNITSLSVEQEEVWLPDMEAYNNAAYNFFEMHKNGAIFLENDGHLLWLDNVKIRVFCKPFLPKWPHDHHKCSFQIGSWAYDARQIYPLSVEQNISLDYFENDLYKLTNFTKQQSTIVYACCPEPYMSIDYVIEFERRANFSILFNSFGCCIVLFNLVAMSFPPHLRMKLWLNTLSLMLVLGHLIYFANKFAKLGCDMPYIVIFHAACLILITGNMLYTVFAIFIFRTQFARLHLPQIIEKVLRTPTIFMMVGYSKKYINQIPCGHAKFSNELKDDDEVTLLSSGTYVEQWRVFLHLLERLQLIIYAFTYLILGTICFI